MITKEDADNLLYESKENLVDSICTQSELIDDLYSQLKQRDDEIERLKHKRIVQICGFDKRSDNTSRSIVAMLFWEWRKDKRIYENANRFTKNIAELYVDCSELSFRKAYKMLKDIK